MISELRFAKAYNSYWRNLAPTMELFVRKVNSRLYTTNWPEIISRSPPESRSLINRIAFKVLEKSMLDNDSPDAMLRYIEDIDNVATSEQELVGVRKLSIDQLKESSQLAERMCTHLFHKIQGRITLSPRYDGCGIINACIGDAIADGGHIIEFKDGDRPFRSYEFRQITIYGALYLNSTGVLPSEFSVINSRRGISVSLTVDVIAEEVAGQSGYDYLREVIRSISDMTISG